MTEPVPTNKPTAPPAATGSDGAAAPLGGRGSLLAQVRSHQAATGRTSPVRAPTTASARAGAHTAAAEAASAREAAEAPAAASTPAAAPASTPARPPKTPVRAPAALNITGRRGSGRRRTPRSALASALQSCRSPAGFSTSLLQMVSNVVSGQELKKGCRVWLDRGGGAFSAGKLLSEPQRESGRCIVKVDGDDRPIQCHASQLCPSERFGADNECLVEKDDRCLLRTPSSPEPKECVAVTRPNHDGRLVVRVDGGYQGGGKRACRLVHVGQLEVLDESWWERQPPVDEVKEESKWASLDDPTYAPYYRMLKVGAPPPAVAQKMARDGNDPLRIEATSAYADGLTVGSASKTAPGGSVAALFGAKGGPVLPPKKRKTRTVKQLGLDYHDTDTEGSIWGDIEQLNGIEVHKSDLEKLFVKMSTPSSKKVVKRRASPTEQKEVVLAPKRSTNVAIGLAGARLDGMDVDDLRRAVSRCDAGAFSKDQLDALKTATPSADEASRLKTCDASNEYGKYAEAERFMCRVVLGMGLETFDKRVAALRFRSAFGERAAHVAKQAADLRRACAGVTSSPALKKLLTYVLRLSKELDDRRSTPRKDMNRGFRLNSLLKLADTKAFDRETSALDYVVGLMLSNKDEAALHVFDELPWLRSAQRASMAQCHREVKNLDHGLTRISALIEEAENSEDDDAKACAAACRTFHELASGALSGLATDVAAAAASFAETLAYLCEDASQTPEGFFGTLTLFEAKFGEARTRCAHREWANERRAREAARRPGAERRIEAKLSSRASAPELVKSPPKKAHRRGSSAGALPQNAAREALLKRQQPRSQSSPADAPPPPPPTPLSPVLSERAASPVASPVIAAAAPVPEPATPPCPPPPPLGRRATSPRSEDSDYSCDEDDLAAIADLDLGH